MQSAIIEKPILPKGGNIAEAKAGVSRRQQIREVATDLFVNEGYGNVSLRQLGDKLGLHAGSLYNHLESKEELLFDLIHDHLEALIAHAKVKIARQRDVSGRLTAFIAVHVDFYVNYRSLSVLTSLELRSLEEIHQEAIKSLWQTYRRCLADIVRDGIECGDFRTQPLSVAVQGILSMLMGIAFWFDESGGLNVKQLKQHFTEMAIGALSSR